jgi:Spy/CpxP family protein refolding chaperone
VTRALAAALLLALGAASLAASPDATALAKGEMPDDPAKPLVQGKCMLCHSGDYLTQQRLTEKQWQSTVEKMRKFGTPANDDEAKMIAAYLARYWTQDLPPPRPVRATPPRK